MAIVDSRSAKTAGKRRRDLSNHRPVDEIHRQHVLRDRLHETAIEPPAELHDRPDIQRPRDRRSPGIEVIVAD